MVQNRHVDPQIFCIGASLSVYSVSGAGRMSSRRRKGGFMVDTQGSGKSAGHQSNEEQAERQKTGWKAHLKCCHLEVEVVIG